MQFYSKELFLDQFTPVSIYEKVKNLYKNEITFLFESTINSSEGNYSFIAIGARERVWYENNTCYHKNEEGIVNEVESNPLKFLQKYYKTFDQKFYKQKAQELGIGLVDGFIGNIGYDIGKEFEPKLKKSMNNLVDQLNIPDLDLIRPNIILGFSHKTSKLIMITSVESKKDELEQIEAKIVPVKKAEVKKVIEKKVIAKTQAKKSVKDLVKNISSSAPKGYFVQIGAFSKKPSNSYINKIQNAKLKYKIYQVEIKGKLYNKVLIGPYSSRASATDNIENIKNKLNLSSAYILKF